MVSISMTLILYGICLTILYLYYYSVVKTSDRRAKLGQIEISNIEGGRTLSQAVD